MSPNHDHGHDCGDHAHDHDHDHTHDTSGPSDNVFVHIDRDNVVALNSTSDGKQVIKPWNERLDEQVVSILRSYDYVVLYPA
jgi:ABC-type Zn2+ transport system substrate-binding protein/surface adhesin